MYDDMEMPQFEFLHFDFIDWMQMKGPLGEIPFDMTTITPELLNKMAPEKGKPNRVYVGILASRVTSGTDNGSPRGYVNKEAHYINLFNYDWMCSYRVGPHYLDHVMNSCFNGQKEQFKIYYDLLKELYDKKMARKAEIKEQWRIKHTLAGGGDPFGIGDPTPEFEDDYNDKNPK